MNEFRALLIIIATILLAIFCLDFCEKYFMHDKIIEQKQEEIKQENILDIPYKKDMGNFIITFYSPTGNRTASGKYPKPKHTIAVDKNLIPLGSIVYIKNYGFFVAEDTGGKIKGNRVDIFVPSKDLAIKLGKKESKLYLL